MSKTKMHPLHKIFWSSKTLIIATLSASITFIQPTLAQQANSSSVSIEASTSLEWNQSKGIYIAIGDAIVEQADKSLTGDKIIARYDPNSKEQELIHVIATGSVVYKDGYNIARGTKLDYSVNDDTYILTGPNANVTGQRSTMTANQSITYEAKDLSKQLVIGIGNAKYKDIDDRIVEGKKVVAFLNAGGEIEKIDAAGKAKVVTSKGTVATADKLNYLAATGLVDLVGNVVIIDEGNILRGARAEVDFNKEISRLLSDNSGKRVTVVLSQ